MKVEQSSPAPKKRPRQEEPEKAETPEKQEEPEKAENKEEKRKPEKAESKEKPEALKKVSDGKDDKPARAPKKGNLPPPKGCVEGCSHPSDEGSQGRQTWFEKCLGEGKPSWLTASQKRILLPCVPFGSCCEQESCSQRKPGKAPREGNHHQRVDDCLPGWSLARSRSC